VSVAQLLRLRQLRKRRKSGGIGGTLGMIALAPLLGIAAIASCGIVAGMSYVQQVEGEFPEPAEAIASRGGGAKIYDRHGTLLYQFLDDSFGLQNRVKLEQISPVLQDATIAAEDASFYENPGINVRGIARAAVENLRPGDDFLEGSGGSSITQQLVKQIYFTAKERKERSLDRKAKEAVLAVRITEDYSKEQILEWYLNEIPYGNLFVGAETAAIGYFGILASQVSAAQAAFLAGLPQSPARYDPFTQFDAARARQHVVLDLMVRHGKLTAEEGAWAKLEVIQLAPMERPFSAPHFVQYVADYLRATIGEEALLRGGISVWTTLDLELNLRANEILEQHVSTYEESSGGHNGAVVVINPPTGQILAMVGSRSYFRADIDGEVNNATALNSPGSTLKPFTYATAFMRGWGPEWPIIDSAIKYKDDLGTEFSPRNPDGRNRGTMPVKQALGNSFNIPAFKTILWVGFENVRNTAKRMGITTLDADLGPALTLGGSDVKLLDMVYAYSTFANNGIIVGAPPTGALPGGNRALDPISVLLVVNGRGETLTDNTGLKYEAAIGPEYAYMITDILSSDENRSITYGRGGPLNIPGHRVAVKTGTSEPYENNKKLIGDTWTIGYTPDIAVGVWAGNSDNAPMQGILSTTIAGSTWHDVMVASLDGRPARDWAKPEGIVEAEVCVPSGRLPKPGERCRTVKGRFAKAAIEGHDEKWWGGQTVERSVADLAVGKLPAGLDTWKAYLANEYLRGYGTGAPPPKPVETKPAGGPPAAQATASAPSTAEPTPVPTEKPSGWDRIKTPKPRDR
jgi:membrane peptidoglycan carboxypeptidase